MPDAPPPIVVTTRAIDAPTVFADGLYHMHTVNGVMRLAFVTNTAEPVDPKLGDAGIQAKHAVIVAMPLSQLRSLATYVHDSLVKWEAAGLLPPED